MIAELGASLGLLDLARAAGQPLKTRVALDVALALLDFVPSTLKVSSCHSQTLVARVYTASVSTAFLTITLIVHCRLFSGSLTHICASLLPLRFRIV
jgi:hypothetical protein